jgi:hypothetical protein
VTSVLQVVQDQKLDSGPATRKTYNMKTTLDLPDALVNEITLRASREGREVKDLIADMLTTGMLPTKNASLPNGAAVSKTLPLIKLRPVQPTDARKLTTQEWCDLIKEVELQLEVERYEKALGHQYVDRFDTGNAPPS